MPLQGHLNLSVFLCRSFMPHVLLVTYTRSTLQQRTTRWITEIQVQSIKIVYLALCASLVLWHRACPTATPPALPPSSASPSSCRLRIDLYRYKRRVQLLLPYSSLLCFSFSLKSTQRWGRKFVCLSANSKSHILGFILQSQISKFMRCQSLQIANPQISWVSRSANCKIRKFSRKKQCFYPDPHWFASNIFFTYVSMFRLAELI